MTKATIFTTKNKINIIGIDEVGRGPLAGPVTTAAVLLTHSSLLPVLIFQKKLGIKLRDSKKLSPKQRELWFRFIKQQKIPYAVSHVSHKIIDKINISEAANLAATRTLQKLITKNKRLITNDLKIFLDGGLKILPIFSNSLPPDSYALTTIIHGDEKIPAIMLASIIAKIQRDKLMERNHKKYPQYNFDRHKGYGTKFHYQALKLNGISKIHRQSFLKSISKRGLLAPKCARPETTNTKKMGQRAHLLLRLPLVEAPCMNSPLWGWSRSAGKGLLSESGPPT